MEIYQGSLERLPKSEPRKGLVPRQFETSEVFAGKVLVAARLIADNTEAAGLWLQERTTNS